MTASLIPLTLALVLGTAAAEEGATVAPASPDAASLVGDADAAGKKRGAKKRGQGGKSGDRGDQKSGDQRGDQKSGDQRSDRGTAPAGEANRAATPLGDGARAASERAPEASSRPATTRKEEVRLDTSSRATSSHASAERASSGRHESATRHAPANYRGHADPARTDRHASGTRHASASRHAPAVKATAARHRAAVHHSSASRHHAAWVSHHRPHHWYSPWRPGYRVHWYHGVFVYGPPVVYVDSDGHAHARGSGDGPAPEPRKPDVERAGKFSLGVRGASYISGFHEGGGGYGDAGLGLAARYRIIDPLGIEAQWTYHDQSWSQETARIQQPLSVSAQLFAFPWTKVNPYVLAGVTFTDRNLDQPLATGTFATDQALWGPHGGVGLEFGLGKDVSLNFDARWIGYVNKPVDDPALAGAFQGNMGLNFYF